MRPELNRAVKHEEIVTVCAWCHRARIITDDFRIVWSKEYTLSEHQVLSHTICPACKERVMMQGQEEMLAVG